MTGKTTKREQLLDSAAEAFWTNGYTATSLADIAKHSGVPLGNIYYYFKTKAAIAIGVADIFIEETRASLTEIDNATSEPREKLQAFVALLKESAVARARRGCPLAHSVQDFTTAVPEAAEGTNKVFELLIDWLTSALKEAGNDKAAKHARTAIALWQGAIILAHAANQERILVDTLEDLETDFMIWCEP